MLSNSRYKRKIIDFIDNDFAIVRTVKRKLPRPVVKNLKKEHPPLLLDPSCVPSSSNAELTCCGVVFITRQQLLVHKHMVHSRFPPVAESSETIECSVDAERSYVSNTVDIESGTVQTDAKTAEETETAIKIAAAVAKLEQQTAYKGLAIPSYSVINVAATATMRAADSSSSEVNSATRMGLTTAEKRLAIRTKAVIELTTGARQDTRAHTITNVEGIPCKCCHVVIMDNCSATFVAHILGHIFTVPPNLSHVRFCCALCATSAPSLQRILHHSLIHPGIPLSQIILTYPETEEKAVFDHLMAVVRSLFGELGAQKVWSFIDSSASFSTRRSTVTPQYYCCYCDYFVEQTQLSQHILQDFEVAAMGEPVDTFRQQGGRFKCELCAHIFVGSYARRTALFHALSVHSGICLATIFAMGRNKYQLLTDYLHRIVQRLFSAQDADHVTHIVTNMPTRQPGSSDTPMKKRKLSENDRDGPMKKTGLKSVHKPVHALSIMSKNLPAHLHFTASNKDCNEEEPDGWKGENSFVTTTTHLTSEMDLASSEDIKPDVSACLKVIS